MVIIILQLGVPPNVSKMLIICIEVIPITEDPAKPLCKSVYELMT